MPTPDYNYFANLIWQIADLLHYFRGNPLHQGLDNRTPGDVFYKRKPLPKAV